MLMRISVQPELAVSPLKFEDLFLHYRFPLDVGNINLSIKGVEGIALIGSMDGYELKSENLMSDPKYNRLPHTGDFEIESGT